MGASAGGVSALKTFLKCLPADLPASVFIVQHTAPRSDNALVEVLARNCALPVSSPNGNTTIQQGHVYVSAPDRHLLVEGRQVDSVMGPKENRHRPAIDALFRSAARYYGSRVIGVVLTGLLDDGTAGMWEIKRRGGIAVVQDPEDAEYPQMPRSVLEHVQVDYCVLLKEIPSLLDSLSRQNVVALRNTRSVEGFVMKAHETHLSCPECGGPLQHLKYGRLDGFRCRVGHTYSTQSVLSAHSEREEAALWHAIVALEEGADLAKELAGSVESRFSPMLRKEAVAKRALAKSIRATIQALPRITAVTEAARSSRRKPTQRQRGAPGNSHRMKASAA